jgi:transposase InsO family protein
MRIEQSEKKRCTELLCSLLGYSRQAYYKGVKADRSKDVKSRAIVEQIKLIRKDQPRTGSDKIHILLSDFKQWHGIKMGRDALLDLMREEYLLVRPKRRRAKTTFSFHRFRRYPNRIKGFTPKAPNMLWVSDITYLPVNHSFAYLSLVTDAYSRKIVGYNLGKTLESIGCEQALKMAIRDNPVRCEQILHHSDRGIQYCSNGYIKLLGESHIGISMTESGDPLENALAERVNGILKGELLAEKYEHYDQAQLAVTKAIDLYNNKRLHSSIAMLTPQQAHGKTEELKRCWKNYYPKKRLEEVTMDG